MKKAIDFFTAHPARFFLLAALLWGGFMCFLNYKDGADFSWHDLLVEANGLVFDLLVFGSLLSIYESIRDKKEKIEQQRREKEDKIERLHEEIDDYRYWDEKEATYRIVGAVKRLSKLGVSNINLSSCYLQRANLIMANLWTADLHEANLQEANLWLANIGLANIGVANLQGACLLGANLREATLTLANLQGAYLQEANLQGAYLEEANLQRANLLGAIVETDWFEKLEEWQVIGREEIKEKYLIDENGVLQEKQ